jgi:hypothetical protein
MKTSLLFLFLFAMAINFTPQVTQARFLPDDIMNSASLVTGTPQITEAVFNERISQLQTTFAPIVKGHGGRFSLKAKWKNDRLVARATQMFGSWKVEFSGGLARRPELSPDGMTLIVCHEIGHHLAGFPYDGSWAAAEGEADYFSTHVCAKKMWGQETQKNAEARASVKPFAKLKCDSIYSSTPDQDLCYRTSVASESVIQTMASLLNRPMPQFDSPDSEVVTKTLLSHPGVQCRMDTLFQGGNCSAQFNEQTIPGKKVSGGKTSVEAEQEASANSCTQTAGYSEGLRPSCWFKARL